METWPQHMSTNAQTREECSDAHKKMACSPQTHSKVLLEKNQLEYNERRRSRNSHTFQLPAERFWSDPAEPSRVAGLELSARSVRYGFTTDGCQSISTPLGDLENPGIGPTPSH